MKKKRRVFYCDFETTTYAGQTFTEVWAAACVEEATEDVKIFHSIDDQFNFFVSLNSSIICYYHNLKFDGSFWLPFLLKIGLKQGLEKTGPEELDIRFMDSRSMPDKTFVYSVSSMGQWYRIIIKYNGKFIEIRDSLKMLPFSLKVIGKSFQTKHQKLEMEYKGFRYAGCEITDEEKEYIKNDVLVLKEAMETVREQGHTKLTIGSCCLAEYKRTIGLKYYPIYHPNLYEIPIDENLYQQKTAGDYIHRAYKGGWCYLVKGKESRIFHNGTTADVNSLYPSMMSSRSGNFFPIGEPIFWSGNYIPDEINEEKYFFIRIKCRFNLKPGKLPFIQIKDNWLYTPREMLETSDIYSISDKKYYKFYRNLDGDIVPALVTLTLTQTDYKLFLEHYDVEDFEIVSGCYFDVAIGIFDRYIDHYKKIKLESKGAVRELAKLFLNNLYGKMASNKDSSFKVAYEKDDGSLGFYTVTESDKEPGYIAIGAAITSYARNYTIRAAQANYHGKDKPGFIYADTDSIHCDLQPEQIRGITVDEKEFCCWKLEACWDTAYFVRPKTYIEHVTHENQKPLDNPFYSVKCAGMPQKCKELFVRSLTGDTDNIPDSYTEDDNNFIKLKRELSDFDIGLKVPGKLLPKRIPGGIILQDTTYIMRKI